MQSRMPLRLIQVAPQFGRQLTPLGFGWLIALLLGSPLAIAAESKDSTGLDFFESKIRPVLATHCYKCHSTSAGKAESGLTLDTREKIRAGGDRGPAVVPGDPKSSILLTAISHTDDDLKMPPKKERLPDSVIADIRAWIEMGAPDPRTGEATTLIRPSIEYESARRFWSLQKPVSHAPPATKNPGWARRDLDHFILARLEAADLAPSGDADPATLLRRLHFALVGLPPTAEEVNDLESEEEVAPVARSGLGLVNDNEDDEESGEDLFGPDMEK